MPSTGQPPARSANTLCLALISPSAQALAVVSSMAVALGARHPSTRLKPTSPLSSSSRRQQPTLACFSLMQRLEGMIGTSISRTAISVHVSGKRGAGKTLATFTSPTASGTMWPAQSAPQKEQRSLSMVNLSTPPQLAPHLTSTGITRCTGANPSTHPHPTSMVRWMMPACGIGPLLPPKLKH